MKTLLNFGGFYDSIHSENIDTQIENEAEYYINEYENKHLVKKYLTEHDLEFWELYDYQKTYISYSKNYVDTFNEWFLSEFGFDAKIVYENLYSPKYYNYSTDSVNVETKLSVNDIKKILNNSDYDLLDLFEKEVENMTTSVSGYIAFLDYDNVINTINEQSTKGFYECFFNVLLEVFNNEFFYDYYENFNELEINSNYSEFFNI